MLLLTSQCTYSHAVTLTLLRIFCTDIWSTLGSSQRQYFDMPEFKQTALLNTVLIKELLNSENLSFLSERSRNIVMKSDITSASLCNIHRF